MSCLKSYTKKQNFKKYILEAKKIPFQTAKHKSHLNPQGRYAFRPPSCAFTALFGV